MSSGVPLVSFVLVNWRTEEWLLRALNSIAAQTYSQREIVLVDNASPGFDLAQLVDFPDLILIRNERNRGFAAANNQGINACHGDFVVLLNCDASLDPEFTRRALAVFSRNEQLGTVVPKILKDDGSGRIDSVGHVMYEDRTPAQRGAGELDQGQYDYGCYVFGGTAAAIMYRRSMLEAVASRRRGLSGKLPVGEVFDESFFAYYEDVDLDWRALLAGWQAYYEPRCRAWHRGHGSGGRASYAIRLRAEKNRYLMLAKNDTLLGQLGSVIPLLRYELWHLARTLLSPWLWAGYGLLLANLPRALSARREAWAARRRQPADLGQHLRRRGLQAPELAAAPAPAGAVVSKETEATGEFPLVSVVVLNRDELELTRACLASLYEQSYAPLEVILVDNGSEVDAAALLAVEFPALKPLRLERNHGFSGGVNWGLTLAQGELLMLVNNDCVCHSDCVRNLAYAARRTGAPAVSGRLVNVGSVANMEAALDALEMELASQMGEAVTGEPPAPVAAAMRESLRNHGRSITLWHTYDAYAGTNECFDPSGGLCLIQRRAVEAMLPQLFPHLFFAYGEDLHLGLRLRGQGGWIAKEPRAAAAHLHHATARRLGGLRIRFVQERNRVLNILGCYPADVIWKLLPLLTLQHCAVALMNIIKRPAHFLGWLGAHLWILSRPLWLARWRRTCRRFMQMPDASWLSELSARIADGRGPLSSFSQWWCRITHIPHREARGTSRSIHETD